MPKSLILAALRFSWKKKPSRFTEVVPLDERFSISERGERLTLWVQGSSEEPWIFFIILFLAYLCTSSSHLHVHFIPTPTSSHVPSSRCRAERKHASPYCLRNYEACTQIYIYVCMYVCVCVYLFIYVYIYKLSRSYQLEPGEVIFSRVRGWNCTGCSAVCCRVGGASKSRQEEAIWSDSH